MAQVRLRSPVWVGSGWQSPGRVMCGQRVLFTSSQCVPVFGPILSTEILLLQYSSGSDTCMVCTYMSMTYEYEYVDLRTQVRIMVE